MGTVTYVLACLVALVAYTDAYKIGVGRADCTGPTVEITFMGYASLTQQGNGLHLRQFSRAYIIVDDDGNRVVYTTVDTGMMGYGVRRHVLSNLKAKFGDLYTEQNVILSGTHTHGTPGGFLMDLLFDLTSFGFVPQTFHSLVDGITESIVRAHNNIRDGRIFISQGEVLDANINRSPTAYLNNPPEERAQYQYDVDKTLVQMRFVDSVGVPFGALNWFAVHPTSMNNSNHLVTSDNVGYASILLEQKMSPNSLPGKGDFVGAFASTNLGDTSPNIDGPKCEYSRNRCDNPTSTCPAAEGPCFASGPGRDMFESTKIIAERIYNEADSLLSAAGGREVTGPVKSIHQFVEMPKQNVTFYNPKTMKNEVGKGCLPAMGYSFAAGTTDGVGLFTFEQSETTDNPLWNIVRNFLATPTPDDIECQSPKPILLATGRFDVIARRKKLKLNILLPYEWQPKIVPLQVAFVGDVTFAAVPGEFTTMAGRRFRDRLRNTILAAGGRDTQVIIAGLSNMYSDYVTTFEEFQIQRYEGASTIFGPHTHAIYMDRSSDLARALLAGGTVDPGPLPPVFDDYLISLAPGVVYDSPGFFDNFGDVQVQPQSQYSTGDTVRTVFVSANPRNNLMHDLTFLTVELFNATTNAWVVVASDANWETRMTWTRTNSILGTSETEITWSVGSQVARGKYRIRHFGNSKSVVGTISPFEGITNTFNVV